MPGKVSALTSQVLTAGVQQVRRLRNLRHHVAFSTVENEQVRPDDHLRQFVLISQATD